jgi:outer membrane protein with beta-barrel domain
MTRTLFFTIVTATLLFTNTTNAQSLDSVSRSKKDTLVKVAFGVKIGAIFNQVNGKATFQTGYTPGAFAGASLESTRKKWGIQAEALFNTARYNLLNDSIQSNAYFSVVFVNIVALPEYEIVPHLWLQLGLEFSSFLSLSRQPSEALDPKNYFQPRDFSAVAGIEAKLPKHFTVGARYIFGLSNIKSDYITSASQSSEKWMTRSALVSVGYLFSDNNKAKK